MKQTKPKELSNKTIDIDLDIKASFWKYMCILSFFHSNTSYQHNINIQTNKQEPI